MTKTTRLRTLLDDARGQASRAVVANPAGVEFEEAIRKMAPTLILDPADSILVMQEEIFGSLVTCGTIYEEITFVNDRPRPQSFYCFGHDLDEECRLLTRTTSGWVTVNDILMHAGMSCLPFGVFGALGMGACGVQENFSQFSQFKAAVFREPMWLSFEWALLRACPPYRALHTWKGKASE
jgi:coniferyl-aldehyde dehydrogenase